MTSSFGDITLNNKFAIGCIVQWYEIEMVEEYLQSVKNAIKPIENKKNVIVDLYLNVDQSLEKIDESKTTIEEIEHRFSRMIHRVFSGPGYYKVVGGNRTINRDKKDIYTIADYRRDFNDHYCDKVDVLMWGESDSLIPRQTFQILDNLHTSVKENTPKYVSFFGTCKMWDESWLPIEHNEFTDKPFVEILMEDGSFVTKDVEVGISDGINVEILKGVKEGDKIKVWNSVEDEDDDEARRRQDENSRELED